MSDFFDDLPELLSPAGGPDSFYAALSAGADAVYLGAQKFSARAGAKNFEPDELKRALYTAHSMGKKVYVALNTLVSDNELPQAAQMAFELHNLGADAFIIQDLGLACYLKECLPRIRLHASTQTAAHNAYAARLLHSIGFERMVAGRELSKEDLQLLKETSPIEIEIFIHGAMCISRSGQCLMSSMIGGRSGNRGECAQPCRLTYRPARSRLSLRDLCLARHICQILELGVSSLKIEGRMRSPEYVYGVTGVYRRLLDERRDATREEINFMAGLFSRGGSFTDGYFTGLKKDMFAMRTQVDKRDSDRAERFLRPRVKQVCEGLPYELPKNEKIPEVFVPPRPPKTGKTQKKQKKYQKFGLRLIFCNGAPQRLIHKILSLDFGDKALDGIYFPSRIKVFEGVTGVCLPAEVKDAEATALISRLQSLPIKDCLIANLSQLEMANSAGLRVHGEPDLNIYNSESIKFWREKGLKSLALSSECRPAALRDADKYKIPCGVAVYGRLPLMRLSICRILVCRDCQQTCGRSTQYIDRTGAVFPIYGEGCGRNTLYNSLPLCAATKLNTLQDYGLAFGNMYFTDEDEEQILHIIKCYIQGEEPVENFTRGYLGQKG